MALLNVTSQPSLSTLRGFPLSSVSVHWDKVELSSSHRSQHPDNAYIELEDFDTGTHFGVELYVFGYYSDFIQDGMGQHA